MIFQQKQYNWSAWSRHQKDIVDPFYADHNFYTDTVKGACLVSAIQNISYHCKCIWNEMFILLTVGKTLEECQSSVVKGEDILGYVRHWSEKYVSSCYIQFTQIDTMSLHFEQVISSTMKRISNRSRNVTVADFCTLYCAHQTTACIL